MLRFASTAQFKRDFKRVRKQAKDLNILAEVAQMIREQKPLPAKYREHYLGGKYRGRRECHLAPDWLLIYKIMDDEVIFERTGSHSDLFR